MYYYIGKHLEILKDPGGKLTIDNVSSPRYNSAFFESTEFIPNFGFSDSVYWIRFRIKNDLDRDREWIVEFSYSNMHYIDFYARLNGEKSFKVVNTGVMRPVDQRAMPYHRFAFKVNIPRDSIKTVYMRFESGSTLTLPVVLMSLPHYNLRASAIFFLIGLLYGFLFVMILYNLFIYLSLRDKSYLYYTLSIFLFFIIEAVLNGTGPYYIWPMSTELNNYILPLSLALCAVSFLRFTSNFLALKERKPHLNVIFIFFQILWAGVILICFFTGYEISVRLGNFLLGVSVILCAVAGVIAYGAGFRAARFYLLACFFFLVSILFHIFIRFDIIPSLVMGEHAYRFGVILFILFLAWALSDRYNLIKEEARAARLELEKNEQKLSAIFNQAFQFVGLLDTDGILREANETALQFVNLRDTDVIGKPFHETAWWTHSTEMQDKLRDGIQRAALGEFVRFEASHPDFRGNIHPVDFSIKPVRDNNGEVIFLIPEGRDITELKKAEEALARYKDHLEDLVRERTLRLEETQKELMRTEKYAAIGKMASTVSHEMRNPLGTIRTTFYYIRELVRGQISGLEQAFDRVDRNITRCDNIVEELSEYTRIRNFNFLSEDIDKWIDQELNFRKFPGDIEIVTGLSSGARVMLDHESMHKCFDNIFNNSVQAIRGDMLNREITERPPVEEKIEIRSRKEENTVEIEIIDTGGGIRPEDLEKVFEPLFSTKGFGVGLGLAISKQIVEHHHGSVEVLSESGKWTKVVIRLPAIGKD